MTWTDPIGDLQKHLSDQEDDKLRHRKRVLGYQNGVNPIFKTFEFRRVTDFVAATGSIPEGVYVDGTKATVVSDDPEVGEFELDVAPSGGQEVVATYFVQWFTTDELTRFLKESANTFGLSDSYDQIPTGLQPAALDFAASRAYKKLALRWADAMSDVYRLQDAPNEDYDPVTTYANLSKEFAKSGLKLRDDYYKRQGQPLAPLHATAAGVVSAVTPNR